MDGSLRIGRLFDIPILLHYTFLLVIPLFAFIIGSEIGPTTDMLKEIFAVRIDTSLITSGFMDGGRVLRAVLATRMPLDRATGIAATVGKIFAVIFGIVGLVFLSPFLVLIALFVYIGASMALAIASGSGFLCVMIPRIPSQPARSENNRCETRLACCFFTWKTAVRATTSCG